MQSRITTLYQSEFTHPDYIYFSDKLGQEPTRIKTSEFSAKLGVTWSDTNVILEQDIAKLSNGCRTSFDIPTATAKTLFTQFAINRNKIAIVYMGEKVGYGVFARENIPAETYLTPYSGQIIPVSDEMPPGKHTNHNAIAINDEDKILCSINATHYQDIGVFFQHLPETTQNYKTTSNEIKFTTANLVVISELTYKNYPLVYFKTSREIHKGEILGWDYGPAYWLNHHMTPDLFTANGNTIAPENYIANKLSVKVNKGEKFVIIECFIPDLMKGFKYDQTFKIQVDPHELLVITQNDFFAEYMKHTNAPYIILQQPSYIISIINSDEEKANKEERQSPLANTSGANNDLLVDESATPSSVSAPNKTNARSPLGFYSDTKADAICAELNRISKPLQLHYHWYYNDKNDTASIIIGSADISSLTILRDYLSTKQMATDLLSRTANNVILTIAQPNLAHLKGIAEINYQVKKLPQHRVNG